MTGSGVKQSMALVSRLGILGLAILLSWAPAAAGRGRSGYGHTRGSRPYSGHAYHASSRSYSSHSYRGSYRKSTNNSHPYHAHSRSSSHRSSRSHLYRAPRTLTYGTVQRDGHGRIKRSEAAKGAFKRQHPCPSTGKSRGACPGYVIDHVKPLANGGADDPSNMQWQTKEAAKEKDKWERKR